MDPAVKKETGYIAVWVILLSLVMEAVFLRSQARWRGLGLIPGSGLSLRPEWEGFDAFLKLVKADVNDTEEFFARLEKLSAAHNVQFILSVSCDDAVAPAFLKKYFI